MKTTKINKLLTSVLNGLITGSLLFGTHAYAADNTNSANVQFITKAQAGGFLKVSYVDLSATGALALVNPMSIYSASDIINFAFANPSSSTINSSYVSNMKAIEAAAPNSKFFLSVGGAISQQMTDGVAGANNVISQVQAYRNLGIRIDGVDMDFEQGETGQVLWDFANKIKNSSNLLLSAAPQIYYLNSCSTITTSPSNVTTCMALSSGGQNDNYRSLLNNSFQFLDYLFPQAYNSPDFTINGYNETNINFYTAAATAISQYVNGVAQYSPVTVQVAMGEPVNRAAGSPAGTIYGTNPVYDQASILSQLQQQINASLSTPLIAGTMMWSTNADYDPADFEDSSAKQGAYTTTIFGAASPAQQNLKIQISNNSSSTGVVVTLISDGTYYAFYNSQTPNQQNPIPASQYALWCSMDTSGTGCPNSLNLNQIKVGSSFRVQVSLDSQGRNAWLCPGTYTLTGGYHNIQVNNDYHSCAVS